MSAQSARADPLGGGNAIPTSDLKVDLSTRARSLAQETHADAIDRPRRQLAKWQRIMGPASDELERAFS